MKAVFADPGAALALLDRHGAVCQASPGFLALAGAAPVFDEPAAAQLRAALQADEKLGAAAELRTGNGQIPVELSLTPTGLPSPAAVLRLTDLRRERDLEARLVQAQKLQEVGELAAGIAHDFNNLLTSILGAAEDIGAHIDSAARDDLAQIKRSASRGASLVAQLLAFGRQQTLQPRVIGLNDSVREAAPLLRRLLGPGVALDLAMEEPGRMVRMDPTQLDRVLVNLAMNSRHAMPAGGTLSITTGRRLLLSPCPDGNDLIPPGRYATLEVSDTGAGIPPEILPRIFEPFFTTRRGAGGTGLGLSTVHGIVRQSGGYLSVTSTAGQGACFRITLPRHEPTVSAPIARPLRADAASGRSILLIDDDDAVRRLAARVLRRAGWDVIEVASGTEALEVAPDGLALVVSDVIMPGPDGVETVRALRRKQPGLRAILMSGYADSAQRQALQADDIVFLAKPFGGRELLELVAKARLAGRPPGQPTPVPATENCVEGAG